MLEFARREGIPVDAPWRELTRVYRRLEARGEIRGGRFVSGMSGEQFALPHAIDRLREVRRQRPSGGLIAISTADPLNLVGIVTAERVEFEKRLASEQQLRVLVESFDGFILTFDGNARITAAYGRGLKYSRIRLD